jgi:hypothetical protein
MESEAENGAFEDELELEHFKRIVKSFKAYKYKSKLKFSNWIKKKLKQN